MGRTQSDRILGFFRSEGIGEYGNQYSLGGKRLSADHSIGLVAANAVAALVSRRPERRDFIEALWNVPVPSGHYRYYDGMLYMLGLLQVSGNFRIYDPTGVSSGIASSVGFIKGENDFPLSAVRKVGTPLREYS